VQTRLRCARNLNARVAVDGEGKLEKGRWLEIRPNLREQTNDQICTWTSYLILPQFYLVHQKNKLKGDIR
jgi:hypothetical protein